MGCCLQTSSINYSSVNSTQKQVQSSIQKSKVIERKYLGPHQQNRNDINDYYLLITGCIRLFLGCSQILVSINKIIFQYYFLFNYRGEREWSDKQIERYYHGNFNYKQIFMHNCFINVKDKNGNWRCRTSINQTKYGCRNVIFYNLPINIQKYILSKDTNIINKITANWINHNKIIPNDIRDLIYKFYGGNNKKNKLYIAIGTQTGTYTKSSHMKVPQTFYFDSDLFSQNTFYGNINFKTHFKGTNVESYRNKRDFEQIFEMKHDAKDNNIINYNGILCDCIDPDICCNLKHVIARPYVNCGRTLYGKPLYKEVVGITGVYNLYCNLLLCLLNTEPFVKYILNNKCLTDNLEQNNRMNTLKYMLYQIRSNQYRTINCNKLVNRKNWNDFKSKYIENGFRFIINSLFSGNCMDLEIIANIFKITSTQPWNVWRKQNIFCLNYPITKDFFCFDLVLDIYDCRSGATKNRKCNRHLFKINDTTETSYSHRQKPNVLQTMIAKVYNVPNPKETIILYTNCVFGEGICNIGHKMDNIKVNAYCTPMGYFNKFAFPKSLNLCFIMDTISMNIQSKLKQCISFSAYNDFQSVNDIQFIGIPILISIPKSITNQCWKIHQLIYKRLYYWFQYNNDTKFNIQLIEPPNDDNISEWNGKILNNLPYSLRRCIERKNARYDPGYSGNNKNFKIIPTGINDTFYNENRHRAWYEKDHTNHTLKSLLIEWNEKYISDTIQKIMISNINFTKEFKLYCNKYNISMYNDIKNMDIKTIINQNSNDNEESAAFDVIMDETVVINRLPQILMISINRQPPGNSYNNTYEFISRKRVKYIVNNLMVLDHNGNEWKFDLYSILCISECERYFSFSKNKYNHKWYRYDDSNIKQVSIKQISTQYDTAYLLFYQKQ